jgi:3-oxoacyl-[acyl-carrier protein] reductase
VARQAKIAAANVTINNLLPGAFETDRLTKTLAAAAANAGAPVEEFAQRRKATIPARRFGSAAEFGAVCTMLCSAHAGYLTGQNILLDGGAYPGTF